MLRNNRKLLALSLALITIFFVTGCVTYTEKRFTADADKSITVDKYTTLGLRYIQQGDIDKARRPLKRALEINPESPDVYNALAILLQVENNFEQANQYFLKALQLAPKYTRVRNNYAAFLFEQKLYVKACEQLELASQDPLYAQRASIYENLGLCYLKCNDKNQALAAFDRAIIINNMKPRALIEAAYIYYERENIAISSRYYNNYQALVRLQLAPNSLNSLLLGISLARANNEKDKEASYSLMLRNLFPNADVKL